MKTLQLFIFGNTLVYVIISALLLFGIPLNASANCSFTWTPQTSGTTNILYSVKAVNEFICWIAGSGGTVRRTTNGGTTWIDGNPNPGVINGNIKNIDAVDENNAWVTTSVSTNTFIYKTTSGGNNWVLVYSNTGGFIFGINMLSPSSGFAFGNPVSGMWNILTTSNGGTTWSQLLTAPAALVAEQGVENCFQVSLPNIWFGASLGSVYRSTDNGLTWSSHSTPGINTYVLAVHFNSPSIGLAGSLNMVKSTDGGSTYLPQPVLGFGNINCVEGSGSDFWYVRGTNIYRSTNDGENWSLEYTSPYTQLHMDIVNNSNQCLTGWSVGYAGSVTKMTGITVGLGNNYSGIPNEFSLYQNYPNPFNPVTKIKYSLPYNSHIIIEVYDVMGNLVKTLLNNEFVNAGYHEIEFNGENFASGVYFYQIITEKNTDKKKMVLVK